MPIEQSHDPKEFAAFELSGWDSTINGYDVALGSVARQTVAPMLDAVAVRPGWDVLDLCCGPGMLAAEISPPCRCSSCLQMVSPSPVPP